MAINFDCVYFISKGPINKFSTNSENPSKSMADHAIGIKKSMIKI